MLLEPEFSLASAPPRVESRVNTETDIKCVFNRGKFTLPETNIFYYWMKNGRIIYPHLSNNYYSVISDQNSTILRISRLKPDSAGLYKCVAKNGTHTVRSEPIQLFTLYRPWIHGPPINITGMTLGSLSTICNAHGYPRPSISWRRVDGLPFFALQERRLDTKENYLIFTDLKMKDAGMYACNATNSIGTTIAKFYMTIIYSGK